MSVQIFGIKGSQATRAAERFFKERNVQIHFVDLKAKPIAPGEIKRFVEKFGWNELLDRESKPYVDGGLQYMRLSDADLLLRIEKEPGLLRLPLARGANRLAIGRDEEGWQAMMEAGVKTPAKALAAKSAVRAKP